MHPGPTKGLLGFSATKSIVKDLGGDKEIRFDLQEHVRAGQAHRPAGVPGSTWTYNEHKEITSVTHANGCGVGLARNADTGNIETRELALFGAVATDQFTYDYANWLVTELRPNWNWNAVYDYRSDGVRKSYELNGRKAEFVASDAGVVEGVQNAVLGAKLRAPIEGELFGLFAAHRRQVPLLHLYPRKRRTTGTDLFREKLKLEGCGVPHRGYVESVVG